jgi:hypothetical protein
MIALSVGRGHLVLLFAGIALADQASAHQIRSECNKSAEILAEVPKNAPLKVHFSIAGAENCYAVSGDVKGKPVRGYTVDRELDAVRVFETQRAQDRQAALRAPLVQPSLPAPPPKVADSPKPLLRDGDAKETAAAPKKPAKPVHID